MHRRVPFTPKASIGLERPLDTSWTGAWVLRIHIAPKRPLEFHQKWVALDHTARYWLAGWLTGCDHSSQFSCGLLSHAGQDPRYGISVAYSPFSLCKVNTYALRM